MKKDIIQQNRVFINLIEQIRNLRVVFGDSVTDIWRGYDARMDEIKKSFIPGSDAERNEKVKAEQERDSKLDELRESARDSICEKIEEIRSQNDISIRAFDSKKVERLLPLMNVELSRYEFSQLAEQFGGDFWGDKILSMVAKKNDFQGVDIDLMPDIETRNQILSEIEGEFNQMLDNYKGVNHSDISEKMLLADSRLLKWEKAYTKGLAELNSSEMAIRLSDEIINQPDLISRQLALSNALARVDEETKTRLLARLVDTENIDIDSIMAFVDDKKTLKQIGRGESGLMDDARKTVEKVLDAWDLNTDLKGGYFLFLSEKNKNPYMMESLEKVAQSNSLASDVLDAVNERILDDNKNGDSSATNKLKTDFQKSIEDSALKGNKSSQKILQDVILK